MSRHDKLSPDFLKGLFTYNPSTGHLYWKKQLAQRTRIGEQAGFLNHGYIKVGIHNRHYLAHRVIWIMHYGYNPSLDIDHINGDRADNRLSNLREVNRRMNTSNKTCHREGRLVGACYRGREGKGKILRPQRPWFSNIQIQGKRIHLGRFETELEAHEAYCRALLEARAKGIA